MGLQWKIDVLKLLLSMGYTTYKIRKQNLFDQSALQQLRHKRPVSWHQIEKLCRITGLQPGDFLQYFPDDKYEISARPKDPMDDYVIRD